jgi:hypothetical protein
MGGLAFILSLNGRSGALICDRIWSLRLRQPASASAHNVPIGMAVMDQHGCRSEYGPLELRIESTPSLSDFIVHVEDSRKAPRTVYQQAVQCTLESAKEYVVLRAQEYLNSFSEAGGHAADWRCS